MISSKVYDLLIKVGGEHEECNKRIEEFEEWLKDVYAMRDTDEEDDERQTEEG